MGPMPSGYYVTAFVVAGVLLLGLPVLAAVLVRRAGFRLRAIGVGLLTFAVAQLLTRLPLISVVAVVASGWIAAHPWLWMVVLCLTAGLFEETARALGFRWLLQREPDRFATPAAAGLGHGGLEAVLLVGLGQLVLALSFLAVPLGPPEVAANPAMIAQRDAMITLGPWGQLAGLYERLPAIVLHLALSVLVFRAVRRRTVALVGVAIALHAVVNFVTLVAARTLGSSTAAQAWSTELVLTLAVTAACLLVWRLTRTTRRP